MMDPVVAGAGMDGFQQANLRFGRDVQVERTWTIPWLPDGADVVAKINFTPTNSPRPQAIQVKKYTRMASSRLINESDEEEWKE